MPFVGLATLHEHHRMAQAYGIHPAITFGVDPLGPDQWLAHQLMRATFHAGIAVEARLHETRRVLAPLPEPAPKGATWREIPVWTYRQAVGLDPLDDEEADAPLPELPDDELEAFAAFARDG